MTELHVVRAGAGSGKTWDLCETIAKRVVQGQDPARLLATTFTRKAAAELKGRIQQRLLTHQDLSPSQRAEMAERLELAAIGTVHSVGHQLISRYALQLGISPHLQVLDEIASDRALGELFGRMDTSAFEQLAVVAARLSLDKGLQKLLLGLLNLKRSNRIDDAAFSEQLKASAERLCLMMAPNGTLDRAASFKEFYEAIAQAQNDLCRIKDGGKGATDVRRELQSLLQKRAHVWADFAKVLALRPTTAIKGVVAQLQDVARDVLLCPALHQDIHLFMQLLCERTVELGQNYQRFKDERGLVDFTDLEIRLLELLDQPHLKESLQAEFDLVVVDEFQDTNPLQLVIFQRLRELAQSNRWVGDAKQAIYGFRGTDPALVQRVWDAVPDQNRGHLGNNYRSQTGLVQLVGRLFEPCFGSEAILGPIRPSIDGGVERWLLEGKNHKEGYASLAAGIAVLHKQGINFAQMAVLSRTNDHAATIGDACRKLGIPVLLKLPGLLATREGALLLAGLRLVADRHDSLAAAEILHLLADPNEKTPAWLAQRLKEMPALDQDKAQRTEKPMPPWHANESLAALEQISAAVLPPSVVVQQVIDATRLTDAIRTWGDTSRRQANLDTVLQLALDYEQQMINQGSPATLTGLITHLETLARDEADETGEPSGLDAVTILTYHRAKGLEWPVVILAGLDFEPVPDMWSATVEGGFANPKDPLSGRRIRYWPWPFGLGGAKTGLDQAAVNSDEGQLAAEAAKLEALRLLYVGFTRARDKLVIAHRPKKDSWLQQLRTIDQVLPTDREPGTHSLAGIDTTYVLRKLSATSAEPAQAPTTERWLASITSTQPPPELQPRFVRPSSDTGESVTAHATVEPLPGQSVFVAKSSEAQFDALGQAVHAYLAASPSMRALAPVQKDLVAKRCLAGFGAQTMLASADLVRIEEQFTQWLQTRYPGASLRTEVPMTSPRQQGGTWSGVIDSLLTLPDGTVVIIDHKSGPIRRDQCEAKALTYRGQLAAYQQALSAQGLRVQQTWIHFPLGAAMVKLDITQA